MKHTYSSKGLAVLIGLAAVLGLGCGKKDSAAALSPEAVATAENLFKTRCAACHGADGKGDGPASTNLNPKPRNFHDRSWQASATDEGIEKTIMYGGAAVGKSPTMIANPDLQSQPEVVAALRAHIRKLGEE